MSKQKGFAVISGSSTVVAKIMENGTVVFGDQKPVSMRVSGSLVLDLQGQTGGTGKVIHVDSAGSASFANVDASTVLTTGGGNVQSVLNSLSSSLSSETSSRESGDESLATKISVDVASAVSALVDGAPDLLNTLNELAAALGDDANYATTITSTVASINTKVESVDLALSSSISSEESRATAAEDSLASAFDSADTSLDTKLSTSISSEASTARAAEDSLASELSSETSRATSAESSLNTALSSEISRATSSESSLDSRVDDHDVIFSVKKDVAYNDNALVYADAASGTIDQRAGSHDIRDGWAFKNSVAGQKINWYFMNGSPADSLADNVTLSQMTGAFAVVTMDSTTSKPFFAMYTVPQGTGDDVIPGFARSRIVYSNTSTPVTAGKKYLVHFGADPKVHPELERIPLTISAGSTGGPQLGTERVLTISLGTNSAAAVNTVNFVAESVGFMSDVVNREVILKIRTATQSDLSVETAARVSGDASLSARIDSLDSGSSLELDSLEARLSVEESRADSVESAISADLSSEAARAASVEAVLSGRIDDVLSNTDPAALDSLAEIVAAFQSADGSVDGAISNLATGLSTSISSEASRAAAAEGSLATSISAEQSRAESVEASLDSKVSTETARAQSVETSLASAFSTADASLATALDNEASIRAAADLSLESALSVAISSEASSRVVGDESVAADLSTEVADREAAVSTEASLRVAGDASVAADLSTEIVDRQDAISSEASSRVAGDDSLSARIDALDTSNATDLTSLETRVSVEESTRTSADASLASSIATEKGRIDAILNGSTADLDQFAEVVDYVSSLDTTQAGVIISSVASLNGAISSEASVRTEADGSLASSISSEASRATAAEGSLSSAFSTADASLATALSSETSSRMSGDDSLDARVDTLESVTIVGTAGEIKVGTGPGNETGSAGLSGTITIGLPDDVTVAGKLTVNGNADLGNAVSDTVTVAGKFRVGKMNRIEANDQFPLGNDASYNGHMFYLSDEDSNDDNDVFAQGQKWYFCEDGVWFASPFFA